MSYVEKLNFNKVHLECLFDGMSELNGFDNEMEDEDILCIDSLNLNVDPAKENCKSFLKWC